MSESVSSSNDVPNTPWSERYRIHNMRGSDGPCECEDCINERSTHDRALAPLQRLNDQLNDLQRLAIEHELYDAASWMRSMRVRSRTGTSVIPEAEERVTIVASDQKVVNLMAALEKSVREAKEERERVRGE